MGSGRGGCVVAFAIERKLRGFKWLLAFPSIGMHVTASHEALDIGLVQDVLARRLMIVLCRASDPRVGRHRQTLSCVGQERVGRHSHDDAAA